MALDNDDLINNQNILNITTRKYFFKMHFFQKNQEI